MCGYLFIIEHVQSLKDSPIVYYSKDVCVFLIVNKRSIKEAEWDVWHSSVIRGPIRFVDMKWNYQNAPDALLTL